MLAVLGLAPIGVLLAVLGSQAAIGAAISILVGLGFLTGLVSWLFVSTDYTIRGGMLLIRSGPFHWNVEILTVESVHRSYDPTSAPALSLDRLKIVYSRGGVAREILVSPEDRDGFVRALHTVNPHIAVNS